MKSQAQEDTGPQGLSAEFIALLRCPLCADHPSLRLLPDRSALLCAHEKHRFPIDPEFGIPDLRPPGEDRVAPAARE